MRRISVAILAALILVGLTTTPAHAVLDVRKKTDTVSGINCGGNNSYSVQSWVGLRDQDTSTTNDDVIDYEDTTANGVDTRVQINGDAEWLYYAVMKRKADGTGEVVHFEFLDTSVPDGSEQVYSLHQWSTWPGNIDRDRKPWLHIRVQFPDGSTAGYTCRSRTAYFDSWVP